MARPRNPNREKAKEIWLQSGGTITNRSIADQLGESEKTVSVWKLRDKWNEVLQTNECSTSNKRSTKKPKLSLVKNNVVNLGGAPENNRNAVKHGLYAKIYKITPEEERHLAEARGGNLEDRLDLVYDIAAIKLMRMAQKEDCEHAEASALDLMRRVVTDKHKVKHDNDRLELERAKVGANDVQMEDIEVEVNYGMPESESE